MLKALAFQATAILVATAISGLLKGTLSAVSTLIGGAAYFLPNLLFALRLHVAMAARRPSAAAFFVGEAVKLIIVIALLLLLPRLIEVSWPALIAGLFAVLLVNIFSLLLKT